MQRDIVVQKLHVAGLKHHVIAILICDFLSNTDRIQLKTGQGRGLWQVMPFEDVFGAKRRAQLSIKKVENGALVIGRFTFGIFAVFGPVEWLR